MNQTLSKNRTSNNNSLEKNEMKCLRLPKKKEVTYIPPPKSRSKYTRNEIQKRNDKYTCSNRINVLSLPNRQRAIQTYQEFKHTLPPDKVEAFRNNIATVPHSIKCADTKIPTLKRKNKTVLQNGVKCDNDYKKFFYTLEDYSMTLTDYIMTPQPKIMPVMCEKVVYETIAATLPEDCREDLKHHLEQQVLVNLTRIVANLLKVVEDVLNVKDVSTSSSSSSIDTEQTLADFLQSMLDALCRSSSKKTR